jgi:drug/metabolite transporter (DMT)-like permease
MPERTSGRTGLVLAFGLVYVIWGSTYLAIRFGIETIPPFLMAGTRFLIAGAILYAWARATGAPRPRRVEWRAAALTGALMLLVGNGTVTWSEQRIPSGIAALIVACVPLWMTVLDWKRPTARTVAGLGLGILGIAFLVGPERVAGGERVDLVAVLALLGSSFSWAFGSIHTRKVPLPESKYLATAMQMLCGGAFLVVVGLVAGEGPRLDVSAISGKSLVSLVYLIVFGSIVAYTAYTYLLRVTTPSRVATYAYVNPVVAILLGAAFAGEPLTGRTLVAGIVIVGAVAMILSPAPRKGTFSKPLFRGQLRSEAP